MIGQNFDGNNQVIESNTRRAKRKKTEMTNNEDNDQVIISTLHSIVENMFLLIPLV